MLSTVISYILEAIAILCLAGLIICTCMLIGTVNLDWLSKFSIPDRQIRPEDDGLNLYQK